MLDKLPASCCPLVESFGYSESSSQITSEISAGAPRFELWTTDSVVVYNLLFKLHYYEFRIFSSFYHKKLINGSKWFEADLTLDDSRAKQKLELHFLESSVFKPDQIGKDFFQFSMPAIARNPTFISEDNDQANEDEDFLDDLDDLIGAGYPPAELEKLLNALEKYNKFLPTWYSHE
tara:strand:+ start:864 stop:1394 length:531 start_codon:yes stop_codon:yes gene_type:complete